MTYVYYHPRTKLMCTYDGDHVILEDGIYILNGTIMVLFESESLPIKINLERFGRIKIGEL